MKRRAFVFLAALTASFAALAVTVTLHGGAGKVGGSCATVCEGTAAQLTNDTAQAARILIDCGSAFDGRASCGFPFDPKKYGALVLTHAHQDHAARVPELFNAGFTGTVWTTEATRDLLRVVWKSQIVYDTCTVRDWRWTRFGKMAVTYVHWRPECEWSQKIRPDYLGALHGTAEEMQGAVRAKKSGVSGFPSACDKCQELEMEFAMKHMRTVPFDAPFETGPFRVTLNPVKHLPGSACARVEVDGTSLVFSGDLGTTRSHLVTSIPPAAKADVVFVEATYGDADYGTPETIAQDYRAFRETIGRTVRAGGIAWIPAFALDRTQRVLLEIKRAIDEGELPESTRLYVLSPSARAFTELYVTHPDWFDVPEMADVKQLYERSRKSFSPKAKLRNGAVVVTSSGSLDAGKSRKLLPDLVAREKTQICLVGYQGPGTYGAQLRALAQSGATNAVLTLREGKVTQKVPVRAKTRFFGCFSGHGDARENDAWLAHNHDSKIFLIHGEGASLEARAEKLRAAGIGSSVEIAAPNRIYEFSRK